MATIIEFDQRYYSQRAAADAVPRFTSFAHFSVVPHGQTEWRIRLRTSRARAPSAIKVLKRYYPLQTFGVICEDDGIVDENAGMGNGPIVIHNLSTNSGG